MTVMKIDDNIVLGPDGAVSCARCRAPLGTAPDEPLAKALRRERPSLAAGPGVHVDPARFTDRAVVLRQSFCPSCLTLLATQIVPGDEPSYRSWSVRP